MNQNTLKSMVAHEALKYIPKDIILGIGTGTTIEYFIDALKTTQYSIKGAVSSSESSSAKLVKTGIQLFDFNDMHSLDLYIDSADEINRKLQMIKGKGGALTREKILAYAAKKFICIADISKISNNFNKCPLPIEVIPMAKNLVSYKVKQLGGNPIHRSNTITDNGNYILDVYNLPILDATKIEIQINNIPGVVTVGLFAQRTADMLIISNNNGIKVINATDI